MSERLDGESLPFHMRRVPVHEVHHADRADLFPKNQICKVENCGNILSQHNPYDVCWSCLHCQMAYEKKKMILGVGQEKSLFLALKSLRAKRRKPLRKPRELGYVHKRVRGGEITPDAWVWLGLAGNE